MQHEPRQLLAQAFVVCREIYKDRRAGQFLLREPFAGIGLETFPAEVHVSLYAHLLGGQGSYRLELLLRDREGQVVWQGPWPEPVSPADPREPYPVTLYDVALVFPRPGRYDLVLRTNGQDLGHHALQVTRGCKPPPQPEMECSL